MDLFKKAKIQAKTTFKEIQTAAKQYPAFQSNNAGPVYGSQPQSYQTYAQQQVPAPYGTQGQPVYMNGGQYQQPYQQQAYQQPPPPQPYYQPTQVQPQYAAQQAPNTYNPQFQQPYSADIHQAQQQPYQHQPPLPQVHHQQHQQQQQQQQQQQIHQQPVAYNPQLPAQHSPSPVPVQHSPPQNQPIGYPFPQQQTTQNEQNIAQRRHSIQRKPVSPNHQASGQHSPTPLSPSPQHQALPGHTPPLQVSPQQTPPYQYSTPQPYHRPQSQYAPTILELPTAVELPDTSPPPQPETTLPVVETTTAVPQSQLRCFGDESVLTDHVEFYVFADRLLSTPGQENLSPYDFGICASCYSSRVSPYPHLASNFTSLRKQPKELKKDDPIISYDEMTCAFGLPTVRNIFYRDCIPNGHIQTLVQYVRYTKTLPHCDGTTVTVPGKYYGVDRIYDFYICSQCFENYIRRTAFEPHFKQDDPGQSPSWICDFGTKKFYYRMMIRELEKQYPNFDEFAVKADARMKLPACSGEGNHIQPDESGTTLVYGRKDNKSGCFCRSCFMDSIAGTGLENDFQLSEHAQGSVICDLSTQFSQFAMSVAVRNGDDEVWRRPIALRGKLPPCVGVKGVDEEELQGKDEIVPWYCFIDHPSIEICPLCYTTSIELMGAGKLCSPISRPLLNGVIRQCFFSTGKDASADVSDVDNFENTLVWRGRMLRNALSHGHVSRGDFTALQLVAKGVAEMPPPCGTAARSFKEPSGRKFFGRVGKATDDPNDLSITYCEECFETCVKDTPLQSEVGIPLRIPLDLFPAGMGCNLYSKRARKYMADACKNNDWNHFVQYWIKREAVRKKLDAVNQMAQNQAAKQNIDLQMSQMQGAMMSVNLMQQLNANTNAVIAGVGGSSAEAAASDTGHRYGNSAVGHNYLTPAGANAAQAYQDAANMSKVTLATYQPSGNTWQDTQTILTMAKDINAEWAEIE